MLLSLVLKGETNHKVPLFLSVVLPAGGQIYNKKYIKAGIYIAAETIFIYGAIKQDQRLNDARDQISEMKLEPIPDLHKIDYYEFLTDRYNAEVTCSEWEIDNKEKCIEERDNGQFFGFQNVGTHRLEGNTKFIFVPGDSFGILFAITKKENLFFLR